MPQVYETKSFDEVNFQMGELFNRIEDNDRNTQVSLGRTPDILAALADIQIKVADALAEMRTLAHNITIQANTIETRVTTREEKSAELEATIAVVATTVAEVSAKVDAKIVPPVKDELFDVPSPVDPDVKPDIISSPSP